MPVLSYVARGNIYRGIGTSDITPPAPPPPPASSLLVGAGGYPPKPGTAGYPPATSAYQVHRVYDTSGFPATYNQSNASADFASNTSTVWSYPFDLPTLTSGALDSQIITFIRSVPSGTLRSGAPYLFYAVNNHEPDVKVVAGSYTAAQFKAASQHFCDVVNSVGKTNVIPSLICTEVPFYSGHPFTPESFFDPTRHKFFGCDAYNLWTPAAGSHPWSTIADRFSAAIAWFNAHTVPWGVTETNAYQDPTGNPQHDKNAWLSDGLSYIAANGASVFTYWDQNFKSDPDPLARTIGSSTSFENTFAAQLAKYKVT